MRAPQRHGEELFLACQRRFRARPFWVDGAGHNNIESLLRESGAFFEHLRFFMDEWCRYEQMFLDENMLLREKPARGGGRRTGRVAGRGRFVVECPRVTCERMGRGARAASGDGERSVRRENSRPVNVT